MLLAESCYLKPLFVRHSSSQNHNTGKTELLHKEDVEVSSNPIFTKTLPVNRHSRALHQWYSIWERKLKFKAPYSHSSHVTMSALKIPLPQSTRIDLTDSWTYLCPKLCQKPINTPKIITIFWPPKKNYGGGPELGTATIPAMPLRRGATAGD
jgi:hypothetical protein